MALEMLTKQFILSTRSGAKIEEMSALKMSKVCLWKILTMLKIQQIYEIFCSPSSCEVI